MPAGLFPVPIKRSSRMAVLAAARSVSEGQAAFVGSANISWLEVGDDSNDGVSRHLPHAEDREEISDRSPDSHDDVADEPVDQVLDPVSRLCHLFLRLMN